MGHFIIGSIIIIWIVGVYGNSFEAFNVNGFDENYIETFFCEELDIGIGADPLINTDIETTYRCESETEVCYLQNGKLIYCREKM